jgi:penicillin G amidase
MPFLMTSLNLRELLMPRLPALLLILLPVSLAASLHPAGNDFETLARASLSQLDGTIALPGLREPVEVIRDEWGVPHIYARNTHDLFFAQGFVHAQDRLWQMDMYRRVWEGRLAEILGADFVRHDALVRRVQHRGPFDEREWTTYHPEGRAIFDAFAAGVNAFIAHAGDELPVEFRLTGLTPLPWTAETSVLRTQTAMPLGDARSELNLARSVAEHGIEEANRRARPQPYRDLVVPSGLDVELITEEVVAALGGMRTGAVRPPLLPQYRAWTGALPRENTGAQENSPGSNNWAVSGSLTRSGRVLVANDPHRGVSNPSIRYIVHLNAPGWDVIGATEAPLPGVAIGHNGRIAWGLTIVGTDQTDVYVEQLDPSNLERARFRDGWEPLRTVIDTIRVHGGAPVVLELKHSRHGPVFHIDSVNYVAFSLRSTAHEPGSAGYLGALRYHALDDCMQFLDAQVYYHAPTENMVCGDVHGNIAWQASALSPRRDGWHGRLPVPGTGEYEWRGFRDDLPRELNPARGWIATANHDIHPDGYDPPLYFKTGSSYPRFDRLEHVFTSGSAFTVESFMRLQHDAYSAAAARDVPLFRGWTAEDADVERARALVAGWDAVYRRESAAAAIYNIMSVPAAARGAETNVARRRELLSPALGEALDTLRERQGADMSQWRWGRIHTSQFPHAFVRAYDIPAVERSGGGGTVAATGATFRQIIDFADLDGSVVTNAPGQSAQPFSPFYANLAQSWADEHYFPLVYSRAAVERHAAHRLLLQPR